MSVVVLSSARAVRAMVCANRSFHSYFFQNEFFGEFIAFRFSRYGFYSLFDLFLKRLIKNFILSVSRQKHICEVNKYSHVDIEAYCFEREL